MTKDYYHEGKIRNLIGLVSDLEKGMCPGYDQEYDTGICWGIMVDCRKIGDVD